MEERIAKSMEKFGMTYMELLRKVAVTCDEFVLFVREKTYSPDMNEWPRKCGDIFYDFPILSSFGTCFVTNSDYNLTWVFRNYSDKLINLISDHLSFFIQLILRYTLPIGFALIFFSWEYIKKGYIPFLLIPMFAKEYIHNGRRVHYYHYSSWW